MKWYFAINEAGATTPLAEHAKLAVRSALRVTNLRPHLLYLGDRNAFTGWMESHGVTVIDTEPGFLGDLYRAADEGWYSRNLTGHWLRTEVCNLETEDKFVLYTDVDVVFLQPFSMSHLTPEFFACAPEFKQDDWSYFNSGVMLMNVDALRAEYPNLREFIRAKFADARSGTFNDQHVYNEYYKNRWSRLEPNYNWKPYWAPSDDITILHLHGPKLHDILSIVQHRWDWRTVFGREVGDIFVTHLSDYLHHLRSLLAVMDADDELRNPVERILQDAPDVITQMIAERETRAQPVAAQAATGPPAQGQRVLVTLNCSECGLAVRLTDTFQQQSHVATGFRWTLHADDRPAFNDFCRHQSDASSDIGLPAPFCEHLHHQLLTWMFRGSMATAGAS